MNKTNKIFKRKFNLFISMYFFLFFLLYVFLCFFFFFFFNDTATTEIYTLSLHDALPISTRSPVAACSRCSTRVTTCTATRFHGSWTCSTGGWTQPPESGRREPAL